jgi:hypothetical protein
MSDALTEKRVSITPREWRKLAEEAREHAVGWAAQGQNEIGYSSRLAKAAEMLRAADTFEGRAANLENFGPDSDDATIEV